MMVVVRPGARPGHNGRGRNKRGENAAACGNHRGKDNNSEQDFYDFHDFHRVDEAIENIVFGDVFDR